MSAGFAAGARRKDVAALLLLAVLALALLALTIARTPPPRIDQTSGETTLRIEAERAWTLLPGDCLEIRWTLDGIQSLYIDGAGKVGAGDMTFCPGVTAASPRFEVTARDGLRFHLALEIRHLPDLLFYVAAFVGLTGSFPLALWLLWRRDDARPLPAAGLAAVALALGIAGAWLRLNETPPPLLERDDGAVSARVWAGQGWILFPYECVDVTWSLAGARALRLNGRDLEDDSAFGRGKHCAGEGEAARLEVETAAGQRREYALPIATLFPRPSQPPFIFLWSLAGLALAVAVFGRLAALRIRAPLSHSARSDLLAVGALFAFVFALYLPVGFETPPHWENWMVHSLFEGGPQSWFGPWVATRSWGLAHRALAYLISSETFVAYNLVNFFVLGGAAVFFYGILRRLKLVPAFAFLAALLFLLYPVNPMLLSLRSMLLNLSLLSLLAALCFMLDYIAAPSRATLAAMWLALLYNVVAYESGYLIILAAPLLWLPRSGKSRWTRINWTALWWLVPAAKVAYLALLLATSREFYQSGLVSFGGGDGLDLGAVGEVLLNALRETFWTGWIDAISSMADNARLPLAVLMIALAAAVYWRLSRAGLDAPRPADMLRALALGFVVILASVAVFSWSELYRDNLWRPYLYVPIGASVIVFCLALLVARRAPSQLRRVIVLAICVAVTLPALSRLQVQIDGFVDSAGRKATILRQIIEIAPAVEPTSQIQLRTDIDYATLVDLGIHEFLSGGMINSAIYALYAGQGPEYAYFCVSNDNCSVYDGERSAMTAADADVWLQRTLVFRLNADLSVELIEQPAQILGIESALPYAAEALYDRDAPLPARVGSMLGAS